MMLSVPRAFGCTARLLCCAAVLAACSDKITVPPEPPIAVRQADEDFRMERYEDAINKYRAYLDETHQSAYTPQAFYKTALAEYRLERYQSALATLDTLAQRYPDDEWVQVQALRGDCRRALGRRMPAIKEWDAGWNLGSDSDRDKLSRRIVAVANELTNAELAAARHDASSHGVRDLLDHELAERRSLGIKGPLPEPALAHAERAPAERPAQAPATTPDRNPPSQVVPEAQPVEAQPVQPGERADMERAPAEPPPSVSAQAEEPAAPAAPARETHGSTGAESPFMRPVETGPPDTAAEATQPDSAAPSAREEAALPSSPEPPSVPAAESRGETNEHSSGAAEQQPAVAAVPAPASGEGAARATGKIACLLPLTGANRSAGQRSLRGMRLIFGEDSDQLLLKDTGSDASASVRMFNELAADPHVLAVVGPVPSAQAAAVARRAEATRTPLLAFPDGERLANEYVFELGLTRAQLLHSLLDYAVDKAGLRRFGVLYPRDAYGDTLQVEFRAEVQRHGAEVVAAQSYLPETVGIAVGALKRWRDEKHVQAIFIADTAMSGSRFLPVLQQEMPDVVLLGTQDWEQVADQSHVGLADGILFADAFYAGSARPATRDFVAQFEKTYAQSPGIVEAQGYEAALITKRALDSGAGSRAEVLRRLKALGPVEGPAGTLQLTPSGVRRQPFVLQVHDGKIREVGARDANS